MAVEEKVIGVVVVEEVICRCGGGGEGDRCGGGGGGDM